MSSKVFDSIRIKPRKRGSDQPQGPTCEWEGCDKLGDKRAPKGKKAQGEFHNFCIAHVREYNKNFNYFSGMGDTEAAEEVRNVRSTGGRPTWEHGAAGAARSTSRQKADGTGAKEHADKRYADPLNLFARVARNRGRKPMTKRELRLVEADRQAFEVLGFSTRVAAEELKRAYKEQVKLHHPDANGGDRASEDRLRAIITAYNHLKSKGFAS